MSNGKFRPWRSIWKSQVIFQLAMLYFQPKQCTIITELPQNAHKFAWFDPSKMGDWLTPELHSSVSGTIMINGMISTFFMGGVFIFPCRRMEVSPVEVKVKRTSCRRALSVKLHPNHGKRRWERVNFLGGSPLDELVGIFFFGIFGPWIFLGRKNWGPFLKKGLWK